jgi:hypothetical protein
MSSGHSHYYYKMIEQILVNQTDIAFLANESTTQEKLVAIPAHENSGDQNIIHKSHFKLNDNGTANTRKDAKNAYDRHEPDLS